MADLERRRVRLLAPDQHGQVLLDGHGRLPSIGVELQPEETTALAVSRALPRIGLIAPIRECLIDGSSSDDDRSDGAAPVLIETGPPGPGWEPPSGWTWAPVPETAPPIEPALATLLAQRLAELRDERPTPELRSAWSRPGWFERASAWIERSLAEAGRAAPSAIEPIRLWGISAVLRATTDDGVAWFKAVYPGFRQEPAVTAVLAELVPDRTPTVIAVEPAEGWLLLDDLGEVGVSPSGEQAAAAIGALVELQRASAAHLDDLVIAGARVRPLAGLADELGSALTHPAARSWTDLRDDEVAELQRWVARAAVEVDGLGLADALVHGDFHPGNVAMVDGRIVVIDWSDAAIGHPLVDLVTWTWWLEGDSERIDQIWDLARSAWSDVVDPDRFDAARPTVQALAGAYHTVSYAGILAGLEPHRQAEVADGVTTFLALLRNGATP